MGPLGNIVKDALLFELNVEPKPGLVCPGSNGIHKNLSYKLMMQSILSIAEDWDEVYKKLDGSETFEDLQKYGEEMERKVYKATNGMAANKGFIFLSLIIIASFKSTNTRSDMFERATQYGEESMIGLECPTKKDPLRFDTLCNPMYGARGEASDWKITNQAIKLLKDGKGAEYVLLHIISRLNDTCIIDNGGIESLTNLKKDASIVLEEFTTGNYEKFCKLITKSGLSCGGSADILSISKLVISLYENKKVLK